MKKFKRLKSILLKDGNKYAVNIIEWGEMTLEGAALEQHRKKIQEIAEFYQPQRLTGDLIMEPINENIKIKNCDIQFTVGDLIYVTENFVVCPQDDALLEDMSKDPNIIKYNTLQLIED